MTDDDCTPPAVPTDDIAALELAADINQLADDLAAGVDRLRASARAARILGRSERQVYARKIEAIVAEYAGLLHERRRVLRRYA